MSGTILTVAVLIIGALICGGGLYYLSKEKGDHESRKIYLVTAGIGALMVLCAIMKILAAGF